MKTWILAALLLQNSLAWAQSPASPPSPAEEAQGATDEPGGMEPGASLSGEPSDQDLGKLPSEEGAGLLPSPGMRDVNTDNDSSFREVAKDLRCPTCTGLSILESDASFSVQIKDQVKEQMQLGKSKDEILSYFVERYGPWILREPPKKGFNLLAWLIPIVLLCLGPVVIWMLVWKRRVHVNTRGVRANEAIIHEMQEQLQLLKKRGG